MVCLACLLPLFLVPIVNLLPLLFDYILGRVYGLFGWEYRKPQRAPPSCPYKPGARKDVRGGAEAGPLSSEPVPKAVKEEAETGPSEPAPKSVVDEKLD
ncbi:uncharacterized protein LOC131143506 [Malania oleifera]|uniref:uncharacterized protein LOC131143506 n=1 Tax=Malania oleifera TaxID=397392 RepID=UPI0025AE53AE|nr:uncharacterized protein LOC131143506 [Malania oleifera]